MERTVFTGGRIIDGTGAPLRAGSVVIEGKRIADVLSEGAALPTEARTVDLGGKAIAPGFIDMHSHNDWVLPTAEHAEVLSPFVEQGVTTAVGGNCGISPAPTTPQAARRLGGLASIATVDPLGYDWQGMSGFLDAVDAQKPVMNLAELVGHAALRYVGTENRRGEMPAADLERCCDLTREALDEGACGLSFGLGYDPGMYSPLSELTAFSKVAARAGKTVTVHMKAFSKISPCYPVTTMEAHNVRALKEMIQVARDSEARLQLSHFIFVGRRSWDTVERCVELLEQARANGIDVMIDAFPYTCGNTTIHAPFPYWFLADLPRNYTKRSALLRLKIELELGFRLVGFIYRDFQIMDAATPDAEEINGLNIEELGRKRGVSSFQAMVDLARDSKGAALMLFHTYSGDAQNEKPIERVIAHEACLYETDAAVKREGWPNPATKGTFPKILGDFVRKRGLVGLEAAVNRMTGASAARFGLTDRGTLEQGKVADIVVFDPERIDDTPPENGQPAGRPKGIDQVWINGVQAVSGGVWQEGVQAGRVMK